MAMFMFSSDRKQLPKGHPCSKNQGHVSVVDESLKAASFASTLFTTSGSGCGSTFCGCARRHSAHLGCPHRVQSKGSIVSPKA
jgi:hypothetical protein